MAGRRPARDSTTIGSPQGLHLPGILPEPGVVEAEDEPSPEELLVLEDLAEALPPEDREDPGAGAEGGGGAEPVELPRQRAQLPWWYATLFLAAAGVGALGGGIGLLNGGRTAPGLALAAVGIVLCVAAARTVANRRR